MKFIEFKTVGGEIVFVNPSQVVAVEPVAHSRTYIHLASTMSCVVSKDIESVLKQLKGE